MIDSLLINELIYNTLRNDPVVDSYVGDRLFPLIAANGTNFPFCIYQREGVQSTLCKDGLYQDEVTVSIKVVSSTYFEGAHIAQAVRRVLQKPELNYFDAGTNIKATHIQLISADEAYENDSYVQLLTFSMTI